MWLEILHRVMHRAQIVPHHHVAFRPVEDEMMTWLHDMAEQELQLVVELTERDLLSAPGELLAFAERVRRRGWGLALDDVGVHTESLAALPFLEPDVVKLDISLVQHDPTIEQARTLTGVLAHSERVGTALLAEGIETEAHLERAEVADLHRSSLSVRARSGQVASLRAATSEEEQRFNCE